MKACLCCMLCIILAASGNAAQLSVKDELTYAKRLTAWGMTDLASIVLDRVKDSAGDEYYPMKIAAMVTTKQGISDAEKLVSSMNPDAAATWQMKLALADGFYAWGDYQKVKKIYSEYLKKFAADQSGIEAVYKDAAYKYAQMLDAMGDPEAAVAAYDVTLTTSLNKHEKRQVIANKAELLVQLAADEPDKEKQEALCVRIEELCGKLMWEQDLWFGKAIVMKAHVKMLRGDNEGTIALLEDYMPILQRIDEELKSQSIE